jgi:type IV secretory pathway VirB10-like protein
MRKHPEAKAIIIAAVITGLFTLAAAFIASHSQSGRPPPAAMPTVVETTQTKNAPMTSIPATAEHPSLALTPTPTPAHQVQSDLSTEKVEDQTIRITARGTGLPSPTATDSAMRRRTAIMAAELDAKRHFAEWISGAQIESVTIVTNGVFSTDEIRQVVKATVPAAERIAEDFDEATGIAYVTLEWFIKR